MNTPLNPEITRKYTCNALYTDICNMKCPWCIMEKDLESYSPYRGTRLWSPEIREAYLDHIKKVPFKGYSFFGGEPLLFPDELLLLVRRIRQEVSAEKPIKVYTNGSLLTPELAAAFNAWDVRIIVSVDLHGPKGLTNLFGHARRPDIIRTIRSVKRRILRNVFLRGAPFALEALALHRIFDCHVEMSPEYATLSQWHEKDIEHIDEELTLLERVDNVHDWLHMSLAGTHRCPCGDKPRFIFGDGIRRPSVFVSENCIYGCAAMHDLLGDDLFNRYVVTVKNHETHYFNLKEDMQCPL